MSKHWRIALVGAEEPLGTAFVEACEAQGLPIDGILPVALQETDQSITYQGEELPCQDVADTDWRSVDAVVMATSDSHAHQLAERLAAEGRVVLWSGAPLPGATMVPEAAAAAILRCLKAICRESSLVAVSGFLGLPMAAKGEAAIEELANQTRGLFAMEPVEPEVFPVPISFNVIPHAPDAQSNGQAAMERGLREAISQALGQAISAQFITAWVPTFFGAIGVLHGQCVGALTVADMRSSLQAMPGILVMDSPLPGGLPTPATDAQENADIFVGRVHTDAGDASRFGLWLTFDYPRLQAAQMVAVLEKLIESASK